MVDLGPFIDPEASLGPEWGNPLFYFNALGLVASILLVRKLSPRRGESGLADGGYRAAWVFLVGTGLHFLGDLTAVNETWDHQFIHLVVLVAVATFLWALRTDSPLAGRPAPAPPAVKPAAAAPAPPPAVVPPVPPAAAPKAGATPASPAAKPAPKKAATKASSKKR